MDGQLVRPDREFQQVAQKFVCVRVTDMQAVDLDRYSFDYDLTLAAILANADGTVYHRFGGRTHEDPLAWMSAPVLLDVMAATLLEHAEHESAHTDRKASSRRTVYDIATFRERMDQKPKRPACIHCHTVHEAQVRDRVANGSFRRESIWIWPAPERVGLSMDPSDQAEILGVSPKSAAAAAGLRVGDRILRAADRRILTVHDLQWVLHGLPFAGGRVPLLVHRGEKTMELTLRPGAGFKRTDPLTYSWRPYKWGLRPAPGFGGPELAATEKRRLGLPEIAWAFRVQYIVDWGDFPAQGRENRRAGLRQGDIVTSYAGKADFAPMDHFHAWTRLTQKTGTRVKIGVVRGGRSLEIEVELK